MNGSTKTSQSNHSPSTQASVRSLIAALEKATGPDHELDAAIADLVDLPIIENGQVVACPLFTSSIDAAMTLYKSIPDRVPAKALSACREALQQWL